MAIKNGLTDAVNAAAEIHSRMIEMAVTKDAQDHRVEQGLDPVGDAKSTAVLEMKP